jgi:tRNA modification GTPase
MMDQRDTICALSTPSGRSGLALVRISGSGSFEILSKIFKPNKKNNRINARVATLGSLVDRQDGSVVDEAIATCFPAPRSYSGEDMVEISMHGNPVLIEALLEMTCRLGARMAEPGEFTFRAFINGRMDLTQAEAVHDIIQATTRRQANIAATQRSGSISTQMRPIKDRLINIIVDLESAVEFAEEDLPLQSRTNTAKELRRLLQNLGEWIASFKRGKILKEGFSLAIVGRPNVGKSSIFNSILALDRSIVNNKPGTTRDLVSEYASIEGIPVRLQDTAGIRHPQDEIEQLGINRSQRAIEDSDFVLLVIDGSCEILDEDWELRKQLDGRKCILAVNKCDLPAKALTPQIEKFSGNWPWVSVSAITDCGIDRLRGRMVAEIMGAGAAMQDGFMITSLRQSLCLEEALEYMEKAANSLEEGFSEEFPLADLQISLQKMGEVTGETHVEDLLGMIFSKFCIGK